MLAPLFREVGACALSRFKATMTIRELRPLANVPTHRPPHGVESRPRHQLRTFTFTIKRINSGGELQHRDGLTGFFRHGVGPHSPARETPACERHCSDSSIVECMILSHTSG